MEGILDEGLADNPEFWDEMGRGLSEDEDDEIHLIDLTSIFSSDRDLSNT